MMGLESRGQKAAAAAIVLLFLLLSIGTALTARPETDESVYANPGYNLAFQGHMGTTLYQLGDFMPHSLAVYTYWQPPLYFWCTALWYKLAGFGLTSTRLVSVLFGLLAVVCWYNFIRRLLGSVNIGLAVAALAATDFFFMWGCGRGRMDIVCASLGIAALSAYMSFREERPVAAVLSSHLLAGLAFVTHPCGFAYALMLCIVTLWLDRRRIRFQWILLAAGAYVFCFTPWILYILRDPGAYREQLTAAMAINDNSFDPAAFSSNRYVRYLQQEIQFRYLGPFGLTAGASPAGRVKALIFALYLSSVIGLLGWPRFRRTRLLPLLPILFLTAFAVLAEISPSKFAYYLPHTTPVLAACAGVFLWSLPWPRRVVVGAILAVAALQSAGTLVGIRQNLRGASYQRAVDAIVSQSTPGSLVIGSGELWFALANQQRTVLHDPALAGRSNREPDILVMDPLYRAMHQQAAVKHPAVHAHGEQLLARSRLVYDDGYYQVYRVGSPVR